MDILNFSSHQFWEKFSVSIDENSHGPETAHAARVCLSGHMGPWFITRAWCLWVNNEPVIGLALPAVLTRNVVGPEPQAKSVLLEHGCFSAGPF